MKTRILSLIALLLSVGIAAPAIAQIPNSSFGSLQKHHPDFFEQGRQQFEIEIRRIEQQPKDCDPILIIRDIAPMPPDFNPFVTENLSNSPNQTARTDREQVPANMEPNIVDAK
ncbi:hypothetical protein [Microseira sp. BLCC-F43]|jgi:hypothetical protein|uniref:hypothetical protein n=1 Tax=Microseira sp. BLCC-F43 TaxID=3153602 RepID=UPI0035BA75D2